MCVRFAPVASPAMLLWQEKQYKWPSEYNAAASWLPQTGQAMCA
ncbi:hypothetical protein HMPREF7215_2557 [Pyramidobacter piscolens W5455]|uniref:Uncharacterized protein n=1 Tax=Pyramidobacter piscolens W5455 TaxID=352165 RepID=A0ABM9ZSD7_9BACT|nr:hypothetical protein HMPREF7215_2557 [Pyramidobacter piscolens W5455]